jgi:hypothetical protein
VSHAGFLEGNVLGAADLVLVLLLLVVELAQAVRLATTRAAFQHEAGDGCIYPSDLYQCARRAVRQIATILPKIATILPISFICQQVGGGHLSIDKVAHETRLSLLLAVPLPPVLA